MTHTISFKALEEGQVLETVNGTVTILAKVKAHNDYPGSQAYVVYECGGVEAKATMSQLCKRFNLTNEGSTYEGTTSGKRIKVLTEEEVEAKVEAYAMKVNQTIKVLEALGFEEEVVSVTEAAEAKVEAYRAKVLKEVLEAKARQEEAEAKAKAAEEAKARKAIEALKALGLSKEQLEALMA